MPVKVNVNGEVLTAFLEGEIDHHNAKPIREEIDLEIERNVPTLVILDFREVTFMDSSGIGLVMGRYRKASFCQAQLHVINTSPSIYKVMRLAGLDRLAKVERFDSVKSQKAPSSSINFTTHTDKYEPENVDMENEKVAKGS